MKAILIKNKPKDISKEEFIKLWNNAGYTLEALEKTIMDWMLGCRGVKAEDFECPNHYAKMVFQEGRLSAFNDVLGLFPNDQNSK